MKGSIPCVIRWGRREILELDVCGTKVCEEEKSTVLCGRDEAAVCGIRAVCTPWKAVCGFWGRGPAELIPCSPPRTVSLFFLFARKAVVLVRILLFCEKVNVL